MKCLRGFITIFSLILVTFVTENGSASPVKKSPPEPRSFAVFTASYNAQGNLVRGGVCGTVFFVTPTKAITAYHVLHRESFNPLAGFERVRVWLVHENYRAIEMKPEYLKYNQDKDITVIQITKKDQVDNRFVYPIGTGVRQNNEPVSTEGFIAETTGPILTRVGADITIVSVPKLERMNMSGQFVRRLEVNLKAADIELKSSPEYELSYKPVVGISGGPVLSRGRVIAMNSFADPATFKHTWALQISPVPTVASRP